jgi:hypothetical protein
MDADDFQRLVATVSWLDAHPTSGLMLRQLPIEGVDTKWLGKNKSLVLALLGAEDDLADEAANETDGPLPRACDCMSDSACACRRTSSR